MRLLYTLFYAIPSIPNQTIILMPINRLRLFPTNKRQRWLSTDYHLSQISTSTVLWPRLRIENWSDATLRVVNMTYVNPMCFEKIE